MGLRDALRSNENTPVVKQQKVFPEKGAPVSVIHKRNKRSIIIEILNKFSYYLLMHLEKERQGLR